MSKFEERHAAKIAGTLGCFDRIVLSGTFPDIAHAGALTHYVFDHSIRIFDFKTWAKPITDQFCGRAEALATEHGLKETFRGRNSLRGETAGQEGRHA